MVLPNFSCTFQVGFGISIPLITKIKVLNKISRGVTDPQLVPLAGTRLLWWLQGPLLPYAVHDLDTEGQGRRPRFHHQKDPRLYVGDVLRHVHRR
jgi:hypothetical protein